MSQSSTSVPQSSHPSTSFKSQVATPVELSPQPSTSSNQLPEPSSSAILPPQPDESSEIEKNDILDGITLTHEELLQVTKSTLKEVLKKDPVLHDLPPDVTLEEVEALTAVIHGQSITVKVKRGKDDDIPVIVKQKNSRVSDLKRAFQRAMTMKLRRKGKRYKISWKHVWRVYWLSCDGRNLDNDHGFLKDYGIVNKSEVKFVLKMKEKTKSRRRH